MFIAQRIELKGSKKFFTYCRKASGVYRFAYNLCVERFTREHADYCDAMKAYARELKAYKNSLLHNTEAPVKPKHPNISKYKNDFNAVRAELYPFTYEVTKYASQQAFINFNKAVSSYYKHSKNGDRAKAISKHRQKNSSRKTDPYFPKFQKKSYSRGSFYIGGDQVKIATGKSRSKRLKNNSQKQYLNIPLYGYVKLREKLKYAGHINSVTISQEGDRIYAAFSIKITEEEYQKHHKSAVQQGTVVGLDFGVSQALMLSAGIGIAAPKPLKENLRKLKRLQRQLSRKQHPRAKDDETKVSRNYIKFSRKISKLYRTIANIRRDFIQKVTTVLCNHYEYICIEDLNVRGMLANHKLARAISDIGFYSLRHALEYKAWQKHRTVITADRFYASSKFCSQCGYKNQELTLKDRIYSCPHCGMRIDRDLNAAKNLRSELIKQIGVASSEFKPVDLTALLADLQKNQLTTSRAEAGIK